MPAPDHFGIKDYVRALTPPAGLEAAHADGFSWAKNGLTYPESTKLTADEWNAIIGNLRGLLLFSGLDITMLDPASPLILRDVVLALIVAKATELLPGVVLANAAAVAEHVAVPAGSTAILNTHEAAGHLSAYFRTVLASADGAAARAALGVDAAIAALVNASPASLDTLSELASALGNDANFAVTMTNALAGKVPAGRTIGVGGIATGGGDMSANRVITVPKATNPDAVAGTDDTKAMTAARTKDAIVVFGLGGSGQSWQNVAASRAVNTTYQNPTGRAIYVAIDVQGGNSNNELQVSADNVTWLSLHLCTGNTERATMSAIVPKDWFYSLKRTLGAATTIHSWKELRG